MEDLSNLLPGDPVTALTPTSQAAGNMMSSNRAAMTAPGGLPVDPLPPSKDQGDVAIDATAYDTPVLIGQDGAKVNPDNADRSNPFTEPDGAGWRSGRDSAEPLGGTVPRPVLRMGEWNEF